MTQDQKRTSRVSRRKFIAATGAAGAVGVAGCTESSSGGSGSPTEGGSGNENGNENSDTQANQDGGSEASRLTAEGSSTVYPIANKGSSYWNSNPPASDGEYWGSNDENTVPGWEDLGQPDMRLADYFCQLYGFEPTGKQATPPFFTSIGLSHSGTGCKSVRDGLVDIGNSSGPITAELGISESKAKENYVDHVVGRDGQPIVVSKGIYDAGVTKLTKKQVTKIYKDEITNWKEVGGPDQEIYVIGRAEGSGTDTSFRLNMLGGADASMPGVDTRFGQNQQVAQAVQQNEGAIAYMALAFTGESVPPIALEVDGTVYETSKDADHTIFDSEYPLNRDLHQYTLKTDETPEGTDKREAAFLNMFLTTFGQEVFVKQNNYITLPTKDIKAQKDKLPKQSN